MESPPAELVKASLACVETLETVTVLWNPSSYRISRRSRLGALEALGEVRPEALHAAGGEERFEAELFLDTTEAPPGLGRDARTLAEKLAAWMEPRPGGSRPPQVVFVWGPFRFAGAIESLREEWIRFDPDGTPVRAWVAVTLRR